MQGIGAAIMVPGSLAIIAKAYPKKERGRAIGIWAASSALTTALGPVIGGLVLSAFDDSVWRLIFAINLPLGAVADLSAAGQGSGRHTDRKARASISAARRSPPLALGALAYGLTALRRMRPDRPGCRCRSSSRPASCCSSASSVWERRQREPMVDLSLFRVARIRRRQRGDLLPLFRALGHPVLSADAADRPAGALSEAETGFIFLPLSACDRAAVGRIGKLSDRIGPRLPIAAGSLVVAVSFAGTRHGGRRGIHGFWLAYFRPWC